MHDFRGDADGRGHRSNLQDVERRHVDVMSASAVESHLLGLAG
jgi:hypothetical protein